MDRNRYVDLLRVLAIGGVVYGHWLLVSIMYNRGQLSGIDAIGGRGWPAVRTNGPGRRASAGAH